MTAANVDVTPVSPAEARRAKLAGLTQPVRPGPSTSAVAVGAAASANAELVTLANAELRLDVAPGLGGGIARFDWRGEGGVMQPIFRRCEAVRSDTDPNELACYPLLPYSNRIGDGRFRFGARDVNVPRNRAAERCPIHGDGWLARWQLAGSDLSSVRLTLDHSRGRPFAYRAVQTYALAGATLAVTLEIENAGRERLPFGLGMHPFLVRDDDTELSAGAAGLWLSDDDWLPVRHVPAPPAWQFGVAYPLPAALVNHAFTGWSGYTSVLWPKRRLSLTIAANTDYYVLYTPPGERFFCFEPVDHPINAMNLAGGPAANGMTELAPGERLVRQFRFTVEPMGVRASADVRAVRR